MRHTLLRALVAATALAAAAPALAEDPPAAKPPVAAGKSAIADPGQGDRVRVKLRGGRSVEGVILAKEGWERRQKAGSWAGAKRDEKDVGVRLWWVNDLDGYMFVLAADILEMRVLATLTEEEQAEYAKRRREAAERAAAERERLDQERARAEDASNKARLLLEEVEKARVEASATALVEQDRKDVAVKAKRWGELLGRFPPDKWTPETPTEIERRKSVLHLFPNDEEREFLKVFDEWKEAWTAWKSAQEKAAAAKGGQPAPRTTK